MKPRKELPDPHTVLDEVTTFVKLAKDGTPSAFHGRAALTVFSGLEVNDGARRASPVWPPGGPRAFPTAGIYAHCIDGQATAANQRIAEALGTQDAEQDPGDEDNGDTEQAF